MNTQFHSYVKQIVSDLYNNRIDISLLIISKTYSKSIEQYKSQNMPHLCVVKKLQKRNPTNPPKINDRIPYVILAGSEYFVFLLF